MKYEVTRNNEVGRADHGWLNAKHYFSFANYHNPDRMGFGKLRVINDDLIQPSGGFGTHPHRDMEIITIPLSGAVRHEDSQGNKGVIRKGEVQVMSAGTGILHSEFNHSDKEVLTLFQIWIEPKEKRVKPRYDQAQFNFQDKKNAWTPLVAPMESDAEGLKIHQDAYINATVLEEGKSIEYSMKDEKHGLFLLVAEGEVEFDGKTYKKRDAIAISDTVNVTIRSNQSSEVIAIEVPLT